MNGFVIFGYFGRGNLGDETNLRQLVMFIRKIHPNAGISVISSSPEQTAANLKVDAIGKYNLIDIIYIIKEANMVIGGGGSLFQDQTSLRSLIYYSSLVLLAKMFRVRIIMYGQGIGPIRSRIGKAITGWILSMVDLITVRDRLSIITLAELNVRKPETFITAEPLLLLSQIPQDTVAEYWRSIPTEKQLKLGLIIQEYGFLKRKFWTQLVNCLRWDPNIELYLIPTSKQDLIFSQNCANILDIQLLPTHNSWGELQKAIGGLDLVVSTRLHGLVAAVVQNTPCFGVVVDPKIEGFCLQLGVPFLRPISKEEWLTLGNRIMTYIYQPMAERRPWESQLTFWKARAFENQLILKRFISQS